MKAKSMKKRSGSRTDKVKLHRKGDKYLNYEDSPITDKEFWKDAEVFMPRQKVHISLRLDENIIDYFKAEGSGYQSRINAILKAYVNAHPHQKR
jgi:uncharacterized protein (DUF4415 family)